VWLVQRETIGETKIGGTVRFHHPSRFGNQLFVAREVFENLVTEDVVETISRKRQPTTVSQYKCDSRVGSILAIRNVDPNHRAGNALDFVTTLRSDVEHNVLVSHLRFQSSERR